MTAPPTAHSIDTTSDVRTSAPSTIGTSEGVADVALVSATKVTSADAVLYTYKRPAGEMVRGEGVFLFDAEGKRYLDFVSGIAVNALGYGDQALVETMRAAAEGLVHVSN